MRDFKNKKEKERFYLSIFQKLYKEFPDGLVEGKENPDFILTSETKKIGIELTRIVNRKKKGKFSTIEREGVWEKIAKAIELKLTENGIDPLQIDIFPGFTEELDNSVRTRIINTLYNFIIKNMPEKNCFFRYNDDFENNNIPSEIINIKIDRDEKCPYHVIFVNKMASVNNDFISELQQLIIEKNKKINKSRLNTDENWLLVYEEGLGGGMHYYPSVETLQHMYESSFKKIFYLERLQNKLFELKLKNNLTSNCAFVNN